MASWPPGRTAILHDPPWLIMTFFGENSWEKLMKAPDGHEYHRTSARLDGPSR